MMEENTIRRRGFASMDPQKQKEIASRGGKMAHEKGRAHEFTTDEARAAGRKGGQKVSRDRAHMARIGRAGGQARARSVANAGSVANPAAAQPATVPMTNATAMSRNLEGIEFPAAKRVILDRLGSWDMEARDALNRSEVEQFTSIDQVNSEIAKYPKRGSDGDSFAA